MSEREDRLDRLKKIGKHLGAESDSFDEEPESTNEIPHASLEAKELSTKIFASESKVPKRTLNPSSIKVYFILGHQIPNCRSKYFNRSYRKSDKSRKTVLKKRQYSLSSRD